MMKRIPREAVVWLVALLVLAFFTPGEQSHFTLCPLANLGFEYCPGCGLGRSISYFFRGEWLASWQAHPLGIFAVIVLSFRIISLTLNAFKPHGQSN